MFFFSKKIIFVLSLKYFCKRVWRDISEGY